MNEKTDDIAETNTTDERAIRFSHAKWYVETVDQENGQAEHE